MVVLAVFALRVASHFDYTPDDTYIYLQYARNVIQHHEVAFNAGEPTYGITSPLWLMIISIGGWSGIDLYTAGKTFDAVLALLALLVIYLAQIRLAGDHSVALATAAVFSSHIWFLRWAGSGMETSLVSLLGILCVYLLFSRSYHIFAIVSALLILTRPEAAGLVVISLIVGLYVNELRPAWLKVFLFTLTEVAAMLVPWLAYAYAEFGTMIPNTALAKSEMGFSWEGALSTAADFGRTLGVSDGLEMLVILGILAGSISWAGMSHKEDKPLETGSRTIRVMARRFAVPLVWIASLPVIYVATSANVVSRYLMLISPVIVLLAFAVPFVLLKGFNPRLANSVTLSVGLLLIAYNVVVFETQVEGRLAVFSKGMDSCFVYIGKWLNQNTPGDASVLVSDVGAIGYYSQRRICDASGLVSPQLLSLSRLGYSLQGIMHEESYHTYCRARYVVDRSNIPHAVHDPSLVPLLTRPIYSLALSSPDTVYYTVYRVVTP